MSYDHRNSFERQADAQERFVRNLAILGMIFALVSAFIIENGYLDWLGKWNVLGKLGHFIYDPILNLFL
jgi:hypothetical protein